ncbi:hypothetical protein ADL12_40525 [Streptomyces regalis]|uniref:Uncharacterized protein n=1 Tax=Streptomyces regalis TaxID=68262 RepID=A0A101JAE0_9ACTN|nr:hypothetical protein ADL12_40525 [Streptomyces regalis]
MRIPTRSLGSSWTLRPQVGLRDGGEVADGEEHHVMPHLHTLRGQLGSPVDYVLDSVGGDLAAEAHAAVESRVNRGKAVLHP